MKVDNINFEKFSQAETELEKAMKKKWNLKDYFRYNKGYIGIGGIMLNTIFVLYMILTGGTEEVGFAVAVASPYIALEIISLLSATPKGGNLKL